MQVSVDGKSGFCFGVVHAIEKAEQMLDSGVELYSLGEIVHNSVEVNRLKNKGLKIVSHDEFAQLKNVTVLIRAHGEPPSTYETAAKNHITLLDATCPVVLKLQENIRKCYNDTKEHNTQLVILGQKGHAEVNGLVGQVNGDALVVDEAVDSLDFTRPIELFSQTTKSVESFRKLCHEINVRLPKHLNFRAHDTICRQVANRSVHLQEFATAHDVIIFVSGHNSSNGKVLFNVCKECNPRTYMLENITELKKNWFGGCQSVGICGATSTPHWLMEDVAEAVRRIAQ
ncbi:MAG: 4-hydroxy-3-methylbut-2-enyl diphosphate reductase [Prevotellaceae bacterium]|nr:4-hydroxy-3-methylbut-2-enyl diphosphate reductase [Prevotellaceae bacterium]